MLSKIAAGIVSAADSLLAWADLTLVKRVVGCCRRRGVLEVFSWDMYATFWRSGVGDGLGGTCGLGCGIWAGRWWCGRVRRWWRRGSIRHQWRGGSVWGVGACWGDGAAWNRGHCDLKNKNFNHIYMVSQQAEFLSLHRYWNKQFSYLSMLLSSYQIKAEPCPSVNNGVREVSTMIHFGSLKLINI